MVEVSWSRAGEGVTLRVWFRTEAGPRGKFRQWPLVFKSLDVRSPGRVPSEPTAKRRAAPPEGAGRRLLPSGRARKLAREPRLLAQQVPDTRERPQHGALPGWGC